MAENATACAEIWDMEVSDGGECSFFFLFYLDNSF